MARRRAPKTAPGPESVPAFIDAIDDESRRTDCHALAEIMHEVTGIRPRVWGGSMVGFGRYRYRYASGHEGESFLTGFASRKQALTVYVMPGFSSYGALMDRLGRYETGRSCLYLKRLPDVDAEVLRELLAVSVEYMREHYECPPEDHDEAEML